MIRRLLLLSALFCTGLTANAAGLDIRLSDESAQLEYLFSSDAQIGIGGADIGAAFFFNEDDDIMATFGIIVSGSSVGRNRSLQFAVGARAYAASLELDPGSAPAGDIAILRATGEDTVGSAAIGGRVSYIFPSSMPMALTGELFYAPNITSFGDNKDLMDVQVRFEIEIAPSTRAYLGYRNLEVTMEDSDVDYEIDDGLHVGVRFSF